MTDAFHEKRSEPRRIVDRYYSVEISLKEVYLRYRFKIRDISTHGMCLMVRKDSALLAHVSAGDEIVMKYYLNEMPGAFERWETRIAHISKDPQGRFTDHFLVGLKLLCKLQDD